MPLSVSMPKAGLFVAGETLKSLTVHWPVPVSALNMIKAVAPLLSAHPELALPLKLMPAKSA